MNYFKFSILAALLVCATQIRADYPQGYYNSLVGKNQGSLKTAAHDVIRKHTVISYGDDTWNAFKKTDVKVVNGKNYWWDMYSNELVLVSSGHGGLNIEHSVANSWWEGTKNDAYKDIHHLNPSNATANSRKGNFPLGKVGTVTWTNGVTTVGKPTGGTGGGSANVYEPCDEYKGDFARVFMYMFTCYEDMSWGSRFDWMYVQGQKYPMFQSWAVDLLLDWNALDPVSDKEINRNEAIYSIQKNRNPFIDLPHLASYIWGDKKNMPFVLDDTPGEPELLQPTEGASFTAGNVMQGNTATITVPVQGRHLTAPLTLAVSGNSQFSIASSTLSAAEAMSGTNVAVKVNAQDLGEAHATLMIGGDGMQEPVSVSLSATVIEKTGLAPVTALDPDNLQEGSYRARWTKPAVTPDYYLVSRTYMVNGEMKTRRYMTSDEYYDFPDRTFDNDETYSVQYAVGSEVSQPSNVITVKAKTLAAPEVGADDFEVACVPGGVRVVCGSHYSLSVADISGREVITVSAPTPDTFIPLSKGIYILYSTRLTKPLKIYVP